MNARPLVRLAARWTLALSLAMAALAYFMGGTQLVLSVLVGGGIGLLHTSLVARAVQHMIERAATADPNGPRPRLPLSFWLKWPVLAAVLGLAVLRGFRPEGLAMGMVAALAGLVVAAWEQQRRTG